MIEDPNPTQHTISSPLTTMARSLTIGDLLRDRARLCPEKIALVDERRAWTFNQFNKRINRLANTLIASGIKRGERIALLSENRAEYLEIVGAAAKTGAIVCALNWRLSTTELQHCIQLATPKIIITSQRHAEALLGIEHGCECCINLDHDYESLLERGAITEPDVRVDPEDGLLIIYTSGTTGLPKGALISHRAEIARMMVSCADHAMTEEQTFVAWPPMFHMASTEQALHLLCMGGKVISVDGLNLELILRAIEEESLWWLILMPGMIEQVIHALKEQGIQAKNIRQIGAMADLVPLHQIAEITRLLNAPYANTFGATETGIPPASPGAVRNR